MRTKKILLLITIVLSFFQVFCQTGNDIDQPRFNWYHMDMTLNKIPSISTTIAYDELRGNLKSKDIIVAILDDGVDILTLFPDNKTLNSEGTSIAAPMVSGVAALIWSYLPELTALDVKNILLESAEDFEEYEVLLPGSSNKKALFKDLSKTSGILNAYNAIILAERKLSK